MVRSIVVLVAAGLLAVCGGCQSYGSKAYHVHFDGGSTSARRYAIPDNDWMKHDEVRNAPEINADLDNDRNWKWLKEYAVPNPPEKTLLGYQYTYVVLEPIGPNRWRVMQKPFMPGTDPAPNPPNTNNVKVSMQ